MIIKIIGTYADGIYCDIIKDGEISHAYGIEAVKKIINEARKKGEAVEFKSRKILENCAELNKILGGK